MRASAVRRIAVGATLGIVPVEGVATPAELVARMPRVMQGYARLFALGAPFVIGTDAGIAPVKPHGVLPHAVPMACGLGLSPADALRAVTSLAARVCGLAHRKGRIAVGLDADVVAVDGDPLTDVAALHRIRAVFARGDVVAG
jgi:imidazolonepropionase-like amidohydrolase